MAAQPAQIDRVRTAIVNTMRGEHAARKELQRSGREQQHQARRRPRTRLARVWLRAPARSAIAVWVGLPLTTNAPLTPAEAFAIARPRMIRVGVHPLAMANGECTRSRPRFAP